MSGTHVVAIAAVLALGGASANAASERVIGAVAAIEGSAGQPMLKISVAGGNSRDIRTDAQTRFVENQLVTHQWNTRFAEAKVVAVGKCVDVELRDGVGNLAKVVKVRVNPVSDSEPCRELR